MAPLVLLSLLPAFLMAAAGPTTTDEEFLELTRPERNFFMQHFGDCPDCKTVTLIVSAEPLDASVAAQFKQVAESFGKDHAGSIVSKSEIWKHYSVFNRYGCKPLDSFGERFVVYIDRDDAFCDAFPYVDPQHLATIISLISEDLDDARRIGAGQWELTRQRDLRTYFDANPIAKPMEEFAFGFLTYVRTMLEKYQ